MINKLTNFQLEVLEALARFEYLTTDQIQRLGLSNSLRFIQTELLNLTLVTPSIIGVQKYGTVVGRGKIPYVYYLTEIGAELLTELQTTVNQIKCPKHPRQISRDYDHRCHTIDAIISAYKWVKSKGGDLTFSATYYGRALQADGKRRSPANVTWLDNGERKNIIPDAVIKLTVGENTELHAIEMTQGDHWQRDKVKCCHYINALDAEAIEETFNYDGQARIVFVYENDKHMVKLKNWANSDRLFQCSKYNHLFYIAPLEALQKHSYGKFLLPLHEQQV